MKTIDYCNVVIYSPARTSIRLTINVVFTHVLEIRISENPSIATLEKKSEIED